MSISSCPGLQSSQELADCAADPAEPCQCCSHQLECTGAIVLIIFAFLSAPFHIKTVVSLNCRRHCNTITPCHRPVWTYNCCLPRPLGVMFWCICQLWGSVVGMGAMCTTCSPILFSSDQLMSFLAGVSVRCELLSARVVTLVVMRAPDLGGSTSRMPSWRAGSQTHVWLWFNFVKNSVTAGIQCMARICFLEFKSKPRKSELYKWHGVMKSFSTALGANLLPLKAMGALSEGDAETQAIIITISHSCCRWWWGFSATSAAATPVSIFSDLTGSGGSCDDSLPNYIWIHFCLPAGLPVFARCLSSGKKSWISRGPGLFLSAGWDEHFESRQAIDTWQYTENGSNTFEALKLKFYYDNDNQQLRMQISNPNAQITNRTGWLVKGIGSLEQEWWWPTG